MNLRNHVQLIGNLGNDPKLLEFENGKKVNFSLATNEYYYKNDEKITETTWHNCIAWGKYAEIIANNVKKGEEVIISGKLSNRSYEDKNGNKRYVTEINVIKIVFRNKLQAA